MDIPMLMQQQRWFVSCAGIGELTSLRIQNAVERSHKLCRFLETGDVFIRLP